MQNQLSSVLINIIISCGIRCTQFLTSQVNKVNKIDHGIYRNCPNIKLVLVRFFTGTAFQPLCLTVLLNVTHFIYCIKLPSPRFCCEFISNTHCFLELLDLDIADFRLYFMIYLKSYCVCTILIKKPYYSFFLD